MSGMLSFVLSSMDCGFVIVDVFLGSMVFESESNICFLLELGHLGAYSFIVDSLL